MNENLIFIAVSSALAAMALPRLLHRLELSRAKHPSLTGHSRMVKRFAARVPFYS